MLYMIYSTDVQNSLEHRKAARPAHLARLQTLENEGRLLTAGPLPAVDSEDPQDAVSYTHLTLPTTPYV